MTVEVEDREGKELTPHRDHAPSCQEAEPGPPCQSQVSWWPGSSPSSPSRPPSEHRQSLGAARVCPGSS